MAFDFDASHDTLATVSVDSTMSIWKWRAYDDAQFGTYMIPGKDTPSSLTFVDGGIAIGRKNDTVVQLLSHDKQTVLATINFIDTAPDNPDMFGRIRYDSRIQTLWVANSRRHSIVAIKINLEPPAAVCGEVTYPSYVEHVVEFPVSRPVLDFVILTADTDPHGVGGHAACIAAKITPSEPALVAFSVHPSSVHPSSGHVDQILIRKEWFDTAVWSAVAKSPRLALPQALHPAFGPLQR